MISKDWVFEGGIVANGKKKEVGERNVVVVRYIDSWSGKVIDGGKVSGIVEFASEEWNDGMFFAVGVKCRGVSVVVGSKWMVYDKEKKTVKPLSKQPSRRTIQISPTSEPSSRFQIPLLTPLLNNYTIFIELLILWPLLTTTFKTLHQQSHHSLNPITDIDITSLANNASTIWESFVYRLIDLFRVAVAFGIEIVVGFGVRDQVKSSKGLGERRDGAAGLPATPVMSENDTGDDTDGGIGSGNVGGKRSAGKGKGIVGSSGGGGSRGGLRGVMNTGGMLTFDGVSGGNVGVIQSLGGVMPSVSPLDEGLDEYFDGRSDGGFVERESASVKANLEVKDGRKKQGAFGQGRGHGTGMLTPPRKSSMDERNMHGSGFLDNQSVGSGSPTSSLRIRTGTSPIPPGDSPVSSSVGVIPKSTFSNSFTADNLLSTSTSTMSTWDDAASPFVKPSAVTLTRKRKESSGPSAAPRSLMFRPYEPTMEDELKLLPGHVIHLINLFDDGWGLGIDEVTHKQGVFPISCTKIMTEETTSSLFDPERPPRRLRATSPHSRATALAGTKHVTSSLSNWNEVSSTSSTNGSGSVVGTPDMSSTRKESIEPLQVLMRMQEQGLQHAGSSGSLGRGIGGGGGIGVNVNTKMKGEDPDLWPPKHKLLEVSSPLHMSPSGKTLRVPVSSHVFDQGGN
ncbi:hypothetical protein HDU76_013419 [Blyttiomyces sp. JEL0837]|nr:hypothetical protein HDU76_013419 [Blyttiomyces sp. JEL0837]